MQRSLKFISISSQNTNLNIRQRYSMLDTEAELFIDNIKIDYPDISGLMVLSTCNRTEIYFESVETNIKSMLSALEDFLGISKQKAAQHPEYSILTAQSLKHLSEVACGLKSAIQGDKEIMGQIKKAYKRSLRKNIQGSLLERVMQQVIRIHKRVYNQTSLKKGSTCAAYRSLKRIEQHFGKSNLPNKKILLVGAGQIIQEVLAYAEKCKLGEIHITNRTFKKAQKLAENYQLKPVLFDALFKMKDLSNYDAIITAVSGKKHFITSPYFSNTNEKNIILIDLAVPANVHPKLHKNCTWVNIDQLSDDIHQTKLEQKEAIQEVERIITTESLVFTKWLENYIKRKQKREKILNKIN